MRRSDWSPYSRNSNFDSQTADRREISLSNTHHQRYSMLYHRVAYRNISLLMAYRLYDNWDIGRTLNDEHALFRNPFAVEVKRETQGFALSLWLAYRLSHKLCVGHDNRVYCRILNKQTQIVCKQTYFKKEKEKWLGQQDSNLHSWYQKPESCHWTMAQAIQVALKPGRYATKTKGIRQVQIPITGKKFKGFILNSAFHTILLIFDALYKCATPPNRAG